MGSALSFLKRISQTVEEIRDTLLELKDLNTRSLASIERLQTTVNTFQTNGEQDCQRLMLNLLDIRNEARQIREVLTTMNTAAYEGCTPSVRTMIRNMENNMERACRSLDNIEMATDCTSDAAKQYHRRDFGRAPYSSDTIPMHTCGSDDSHDPDFDEYGNQHSGF